MQHDDAAAISTHVLRLIAVYSSPPDDCIDVFVSSSDDQPIATFTNVPTNRPCTMQCPVPYAARLCVTACKPTGERLGHAVGEPGWLHLSPTLAIALALEPTTTKVEDNTHRVQPSAEELRAAYQLEQWRLEQERRHALDLQQRTAERLAQLQAEWDAREQQRVMELQVAYDR